MLKRSLLLFRPILQQQQFIHKRLISTSISLKSNSNKSNNMTTPIESIPISVDSVAAGEAGGVVVAGVDKSKKIKEPRPEGAPKGEKKAKKGGDGAEGITAGVNALELNPKPEYFDSRIEIFDRLKKIQDERIAGQLLFFYSPFSPFGPIVLIHDLNDNTLQLNQE
jgi:hypothetical protein